MAQIRKTNAELLEENHRLRAQVAQLQDRLDHLAEHGAAAKALQRSEALHRDVMSTVADVVLIADDAGRLSYVSPNAHFIFGHTGAEILKQGRVSFVLPSNLFDPDLLEQRGEISNIECEIRDALSRGRSLSVTVRRIAAHGGTIMYICRDVTERVRLERDYELLSLTLERRVEERTRELRASRERYRRLVEGLRDEYIFYATLQDGTLTYVSPSVHTVLGYTPSQVIGRNWREFVDRKDPDVEEIETLDRMRFAGLPTPAAHATVRHADGTWRVLEFRGVPVHDAEGGVVASEGICKDITQRQQDDEALRRARLELERRVEERTAELTAMYEQLRDSEQRYRSVVEDQVEYIVHWHGEGVRTFVNDSYCRARGAVRDTLLGTSFFPCILAEDLETLKRKLSCISPEHPVVSVEHRTVSPDGHVGWEQWSNRGLFNSEGELIEFQSVGIDITERLKHERQQRDRDIAGAKLGALSERECVVMRLVVAGDANKVIARKLGLSIKTIEKHRGSLMRKLQVRSVPELVRLALIVESESEG